MENDRELLELAAKAAGMYLECFHNDKLGFEDIDGNLWNPLTDDGDAFRLAVKLDLEVIQDTAMKRTEAHYGCLRDRFDEPLWLFETWADDKYAATRRAIVRAAAEIGKSLN